MKKKFSELTAGDKFYSVAKNSMDYREETVSKVDNKHLYYSYSDSKIERFDDTDMEVHTKSFYSDVYTLYFVCEPDVMRYCKAQLMKTLFGHINSAKHAIEKVKRFRLDNHELLNHKWTAEQIDKLERELGY